MVAVPSIARLRAAKWIAGFVIILLMPGMIAAFVAQVSSFLGIAVRGPVPDIAATIENLVAFSRQLGFLLIVGMSLGVVLAFKGDAIPRVGALAWYVHLLGHELVHALLAKLCGYTIKEFKLSRHGGYVAYHKPNARGNFLISLGPYLLPLIPLLLLFAAALTSGVGRQIIVFLLGMSLGSHLSGTAREALDQYDVRQSGVFFSVALISSGNIILLTVAMAVVSPSRVSLIAFAFDAVRLDVWYLSGLLGSLVGLVR